MAGRKTRDDEARRLAIGAARIADDRRAGDILLLDLRGISPVTDYFVICTGTSARQMRAVAEEIAEFGRSIGQKLWHVAGLESATWILQDFVDVVVHLFDQVHRRYYDLELIWGAAPRVDWRLETPAKTPARSRSEAANHGHEERAD